MNTRTLSVAILLLAAGSGHCADPPQPANEPVKLSLPEAIEMALSWNIDLKVEAANTSMSKTDVARSRALYNPVLNVSGNGGVTAIPGDPFFSTKSATGTLSVTENLPVGGNITAFSQVGYTNASLEVSGTLTKDWQSSVGVTATLPLLKNSGKEATNLNIMVSSNSYQDSLQHLRGTVIDTVTAVITAYNHLYVLQQVQQAREAALKSAENLLEEIKKRPHASVHAMDVANVEFAMTQRRKEYIEAVRNFRDQEESFRYLVGIADKKTVVAAAPPSRVEPPENDAQAEANALQNRTDLQQLQIALQTAKLQERVAKHQTLPELTVSAGGGATSTGLNFGDSFSELGAHPGSYWNTGVQFSYPLGNAAAKNDYVKNKIKREQTEDQIRALTWKIRNDVQSDMRALISARLQLQYADKGKVLAEQRVEEYRKNNRLGATNATVQDVLNAENDRFSAQSTQMEAEETFSNGVAKLWKDTGVLLERMGIRLDTYRSEKIGGSGGQ